MRQKVKRVLNGTGEEKSAVREVQAGGPFFPIIADNSHFLNTIR